MSPFTKTALVLLGICLPLAATQARVCIVSNFDTSGCKRGDDLLFMPPSFGNEQFPIEFAGKKCDLSKPITLNKGGVVCTYAGTKEIVDGPTEALKVVYAAKYREAQSNPKEWVGFSNGTYWRVVPNLIGKVQNKNSISGPIAVGDYVNVYYASCWHENGQELLGEYVLDAEFEILEDHYLWQSGPLTNGCIVEKVGPTSHGFIRVEHVAKPKKNVKGK